MRRARTKGGEGKDPKPPKKEIQNKSRPWIKEFERKLTRAALKTQTDLVLACVNSGLERDEEFSPKELIFNNEMASSLAFKDEDDAEAFLKRYRDGREAVEWVDPLGGHSDGVRVLRVERDATFDQRLRGQAYFHLEQHTANLLSKKAKWGANMKLDNSGIRGVFFCTNGDEIWELFQVKFAHCGGGSSSSPM